jgi:DNA-binding helix-hairpin-helix protein with protein kinase domain
MYFIRQSTGQRIILGSSSALAVGGEARIVAVPRDAGLVAKLYHYPAEQHARKLAAMLASPPQDPMAQGTISIAWPVDLLLADEGGPPRVVGVVMPRVRDMRPIIDFYHPKTRRQQCPLFNYLPALCRPQPGRRHGRVARPRLRRR